MSAIKDKATNHTIPEDQLQQIVSQYCHSLKDPWPSHEDVLKAFQVFDSEGVGFIKVTMLKRFLVNAQLEVDDTNCECHMPLAGPVCMCVRISSICVSL